MQAGMSFESTAEGRVGVDGADRWRKTVPHVGTADRELKPIFRTGFEFSVSWHGRSGADLPMCVG